MLHDTTAEWTPVSVVDTKTLLHVMTRIMTRHAHDETHGGVASGPLG
jgi:hypothetical protein